MKRKHIQILGIVLNTAFALFIVFLYATEPRTLGEIGDKAAQTASEVINKGQVATGTYQPDPEKLAKAMALFSSGDYPGARAFFEAADPEKRDGRTQFYIAYSFYRQGWGRFASDDELYKQGLVYAERADKLLGGTFISDDADLKLKTPAALKTEIEEGLRVTADDFNPMRVMNERK